MHFLIKLKTWQIFLLLMLPWIIADIFIDDFLKSLAYIIGYAIYFGYYLFTYKVCEEYIEVKNGTLFATAVLFLFSFLGIMVIILEPGNSFELTGVSGFFIAALFILSVFYSVFYAAKLQTTFTYGKGSLDSMSYISHAFCFFFLPLGIWFLFPKLKSTYSGKPPIGML